MKINDVSHFKCDKLIRINCIVIVVHFHKQDLIKQSNENSIVTNKLNVKYKSNGNNTRLNISNCLSVRCVTAVSQVSLY